MRKWILKVIGAPSWTVCYDGEEGKSSTDGEANKTKVKMTRISQLLVRKN